MYYLTFELMRCICVALACGSVCRRLKKISCDYDIGICEICLRNKNNDSINWHNEGKRYKNTEATLQVSTMNLQFNTQSLLLK